MRTTSLPSGLVPLHEMLAEMREKGEGDFTLVCNEKEFKVHKFLLRAYSDVLYRMATSEKFVESRTGRAELKEVDPTHVAAMVEYFYCADYDIPSPPTLAGRSNVETMAIHIGIACLAEMYNVKGLKTLAAEKMVASLSSWAFSQKQVLEDSLKKVYGTSTPEEVREAFVDEAVKKFSQMHGIRNLSQLLKDWPEFSALVLEKAVEEQSHKEQWGEEGDSDDNEDEDDSDMSDY